MTNAKTVYFLWGFYVALWLFVAIPRGLEHFKTGSLSCALEAIAISLATILMLNIEPEEREK